MIAIINIEFRSFQYIDLLLDRRHLNSDIVKFALLYVVTLVATLAAWSKQVMKENFSGKSY